MSILNLRRYARVEVDIPVDLTSVRAGHSSSVRIKNVSEEGASLTSAHPLEIAETLEFDLPLPGMLPAHIRADILWARPVTEEGRPAYAHGLVFTRIDIADRDRLNAFISQSMSY